MWLKLFLPERSCLIRPLLALGSMGRKSLYQVISGSGFPLAEQSMVAVRVLSTTLSWGPMSIFGKPGGRRSSVGKNREREVEKPVSQEFKTYLWANQKWSILSLFGVGLLFLTAPESYHRHKSMLPSWCKR